MQPVDQKATYLGGSRLGSRLLLGELHGAGGTWTKTRQSAPRQRSTKTRGTISSLESARRGGGDKARHK